MKNIWHLYENDGDAGFEDMSLTLIPHFFSSLGC